MITPEQVARALALVDEGRSQRYAARTLGLPETTVRRAIKRYRETGCCTRRQGSGRPRATRPIDDRFIVMTALRNGHASATEMAQTLRTVRNVTVSADTVRRRLAKANLRPRRSATGPLLSVEHRRARLAFARKHRHWTDSDWSNVLFSDESRFNLFGPDGRLFVYRRPGQRYAQCNIAHRDQFGGGSVMVWGGISLEAKTDLHVFSRVPLNAHLYCNDILEYYVMPYAHFIGQNFMFMQENARPHTARITADYLKEVGIPTLKWPARSPDLNPIEHLWDELSRRIKRKINPPTTLSELRIALVKTWEEIPQEVVANLIKSMPRRLEEVIRLRGGNTRY